MAALVQSFPSTGSTITMLQTRSPSSDAFQSGPQGQQHQRGSQMPRNIYNGPVGTIPAGSYRGHPSLTPSASYAFNSPSTIPGAANPLRQHPTMPRYDTRTASAPVTPLTNPLLSPNPSTSSQNRLASVSSMSLSSAFTSQHNGSKDDSSISTASYLPSQRPLSAIDLNPTPSANTSKPVPDRYKRNHRRAETAGLQTAVTQSQGGSALPSGSGMATVGHLYNGGYQNNSTPTLTSYPSYRGSPSPSRQANEIVGANQPRMVSVDDSVVSRPGSSEQAKRYRRRSISSLDAKEYQHLNSEQSTLPTTQPKTYAAMLTGPAPQASNENRQPQPVTPIQRPGSSHGRKGSAESSNSGRSNSRPSSVRSSKQSSTPSRCYLLHFIYFSFFLLSIP